MSTAGQSFTDLSSLSDVREVSDVRDASRGGRMGRLSGSTALVTGGASGLGKAIAQRLADEGARVVITDIQVGLGHAVAAGLGVTFLAHDVTSEEQWLAVIGQVEERFGQLDILVNNAGIAGAADRVSPEDTRLADWRQIFSVNVDSVFLGCRAGIAAMRRSGGGSIVNMSSIAALLATPDSTAYGAAKAAVRQLTKSVAQYCATEGLNIRCNSVHPGEVRTPLWESYVAETAATRGISAEVIATEAKARVPLGEMPQPEDIAAGVAFLCSPDARFITGSELIVDGGLIHCDTFQPAR
jgi:3(or 17)beta-hydroxysteroid dehydrogenase